MSTSSSTVHQKPSRVVEAPYATNWKAIWAMTGVATLLAAYAMAWLFWPSPPSEPTGVRSLAVEQVEQPVAPLPPLHVPPAVAPSQAQFAVVESESVLRFTTSFNADLRKAVTVPPLRRSPNTGSHVAHEGPGGASSPATPTLNQTSLEIDSVDEDQLTARLQGEAVDLDLRAIMGVPGQSAKTAEDTRAVRSFLWLQDPREAQKTHFELQGLPFRGNANCKKGDDAARTARDVSLLLHPLTDRMHGVFQLTVSPNPKAELIERVMEDANAAEREFVERVSDANVLRNPDSVSTLVQMLQTESDFVRLGLIKALANIKAPAASVALADRAVFDASPGVRQAACAALRQRDPVEYRQCLLDALRYPWSPVAAHAAKALVAVDDRGAVPALALLLFEPDPSAPFETDNGAWRKREMVRINHLRNCSLCHTPSRSASDTLRGGIPTPGRPLPVLYYRQPESDFVRADVTYLKQDFSLMQKVSNSAPWPEMQRYDYLVRVRAASAAEIALAAGASNHNYPQRTAVINALVALCKPHEDAAHAESAAGSPDDKSRALASTAASR